MPYSDTQAISALIAVPAHQATHTQQLVFVIDAVTRVASRRQQEPVDPDLSDNDEDEDEDEDTDDPVLRARRVLNGHATFVQQLDGSHHGDKLNFGSCPAYMVTGKDGQLHPTVYSQAMFNEDRAEEFNDYNLAELSCMVAIKAKDPKKKKAAALATESDGPEDLQDGAPRVVEGEQEVDAAEDAGHAQDDKAAAGASDSNDGKQRNLRCAFTNDSPLDKDFHQMLRTKLPIPVWAGSKPPTAPPFLGGDAEPSDAWLAQADAFALKMLTVFCPLVSRLDIASGAFDESHFGIPRALATFDGDNRSDWECLIGAQAMLFCS